MPCEMQERSPYPLQKLLCRHGQQHDSSHLFRGEDGKGNTAITRGILEGTIKGAKRDIVLLNSGCALYICGKCDSIEEGVKTAAEMIDSGKALKKLEELVELTNRG